ADRMATAGSAAFAAAVRMVDRVHHHAADGRADAQPAFGAGLAELLEAVFRIADLADGGAAFNRNLAHFARTQAQRGVTGFTRDQLRGRTGAARELRALARLHLDAMHRGADRHVAQRQRVAVLDRCIGAGHQLHADLDALGRDDVAALAVNVEQQRNVRGAIGIVLDPLDAAGHAFLVALEVDDAVLLLVPAATMAHGDAPEVVASTGLVLDF